MSVEEQAFKQALAQWATGVTVITMQAPEGHYHGMTASSFSSVSLQPPLVLACVGQRYYGHQVITATRAFAINILREDQMEWGKRFAGMYPEIEDRFADIDFKTAATGAPILPGVLGWVDCTLHAAHDAGDHTIFVGEVQAAGNEAEGEPLIYFNRAWGTFKPLPPGE